jgi:hypothetical protein
MPRQISTDLTITADPLRARITDWRETRKYRGGAMPAMLWTAAVELARRHGVGPTARVLGIDYAALKRRVATESQLVTDTGPTFVDLGPAATLGLGACVIAVDGRRGRRLRLEVSGLRASDLVAFVQATWGRPG